MKNTDDNFLRSELIALIEFLKETQSFWDREIIYEYPNYKAPFKDSWIEYLSALDLNDLYSFQLLKPVGHLPEDLADLCGEIVRLREISSIGRYAESLPQLAYQFMTEKKKHEITQVVGFLSELGLIPTEENIIDFCGGAGYLGRTLAIYFDSSSISIDIDQSLQDRGSARAEKLKPGVGSALKFVKADVGGCLNDLAQSLPHGSNTLGIHTCAHLSDLQFELSKRLESKWIFNVSCCYYKTDDPMYSFSELAKESKFEIGKESLLIAARGHDADSESFEYAMQVKKYRYLLHVFMKDVLGLEFVAMGGLRKSDYAQSFSKYARERLMTVLNIKIAESELMAFERDALNQIKVKEMIACNTFRTIFSRLVEKYIALDRAVYLSEQSYQVRMFEVFDPSISPRNIGILAEA